MKEVANQPLAEQLARAEAIKAKMTELLRELESQAAGHTVKQTGRWRHKRTT